MLRLISTIPKTLEGLAEASQHPDEALKRLKVGLAKSYKETQALARKGDHRGVARNVTKTFIGFTDLLFKPGKSVTVLKNVPAQLKKLIPISAATKIESQVI